MRAGKNARINEAEGQRMSRKGSLLALRDRDPAPTPASAEPEGRAAVPLAGRTGVGTGSSSSISPVAPSRQGKKAMTGYFSPEMSFALPDRKNLGAGKSGSVICSHGGTVL